MFKCNNCGNTIKYHPSPKHKLKFCSKQCCNQYLEFLTKLSKEEKERIVFNLGIKHNGKRE